MDSVGLLHNAAKIVFGYHEHLNGEEIALAERARERLREQFYLMGVGRLDFHGLVPADLVKAIFGQELRRKPCDCPGCVARREGR